MGDAGSSLREPTDDDRVLCRHAHRHRERIDHLGGLVERNQRAIPEGSVGAGLVVLAEHPVEAELDVIRGEVVSVVPLHAAAHLLQRDPLAIRRHRPTLRQPRLQRHAVVVEQDKRLRHHLGDQPLIGVERLRQIEVVDFRRRALADHQPCCAGALDRRRSRRRRRCRRGSGRRRGPRRWLARPLASAPRSAWTAPGRTGRRRAAWSACTQRAGRPRRRGTQPAGNGVDWSWCIPQFPGQCSWHARLWQHAELTHRLCVASIWPSSLDQGGGARAAVLAHVGCSAVAARWIARR